VRQSTKASYEAILQKERREHRIQMEQALDLIGAFYDALLDACEAAGARYQQDHRAVGMELQSRFYQLCTQARLPDYVLTPRQRAIKAGQDDQQHQEQDHKHIVVAPGNGKFYCLSCGKQLTAHEVNQAVSAVCEACGEPFDTADG
jgi:predicted nucleic acid-binding Zn ribbon protein